MSLSNKQTTKMAKARRPLADGQGARKKKASHVRKGSRRHRRSFRGMK